MIFTTCGLLVRRRAQPQIPELGDQSKGNYGVERQSEINEQQTCIVPLKTESKVTPATDHSCCPNYNDFLIPVGRPIGV